MRGVLAASSRRLLPLCNAEIQALLHDILPFSVQRQLISNSASNLWQTAAVLTSQPSCRCCARGFAVEAADEPDEDPEIRDRASPQVRKLSEEIMALSMLDVSDLTAILQKRLGVTPQMLGMGGGGGAAPVAAAPAAAPAAAAPAAEAKTEFDVHLTGFDAASKVKVIKEVRTVTSLGLKEAKELVEKAPTVVKTGLKKDEAEELQKKLEAVGGKVSLQ